jgi:DNA modification methylase
VTPYWSSDDGRIVLYHGDCRAVTKWLAADVLITDPPYGVTWRGGRHGTGTPGVHVGGIKGDADTSIRDSALTAWGVERPAVVFGSLRAAYPPAWKRILVFQKPLIACGMYGNQMPWIRNWEPIFVLGEWPRQVPAYDAVISTAAAAAAGYSGYSTRYRHPHAKPVDVMEKLITACPPGTIADPFAGSGSTLVAAQLLGRPAIGVEIDERYAEIAARRLSQGVIDFGEVPASSPGDLDRWADEVQP